MSRANVKVSEETWRRLNARKAPGDSFEDVIQELLDGCGEDELLEQSTN